MITYEKYAEIRDKKNLTDGKVAEIAGIGRSTFSDWKSGRSIPKLEKMQKIADALEMDYFAFVGPVGKFSSLNPNNPLIVETKSSLEVDEALMKRALTFIEKFDKASPEIRKGIESLLGLNQSGS